MFLKSSVEINEIVAECHRHSGELGSVLMGFICNKKIIEYFQPCLLKPTYYIVTDSRQ